MPPKIHPSASAGSVVKQQVQRITAARRLYIGVVSIFQRLCLSISWFCTLLLDAPFEHDAGKSVVGIGRGTYSGWIGCIRIDRVDEMYTP